MRKIHYRPVPLFLLAVSFFYACAQPYDEPVVSQDSNTLKHARNGQVFTFVDDLPQFPGGDKALMAFLQQSIRYPAMERDNDIQGKVLLRFTVMEDGSVGDIQIIHPVSPGLDKEAVRVVKMMPKFKPGLSNGKPVKVYFNLPIIYKLDDGFDEKAINNLSATSKVFSSGFKAFNDHNYDEAIRCFRQSAEKNNVAVIYDLLGECYRLTHNSAAMCAAYNKALSLGSKTAENNIKVYCK